MIATSGSRFPKSKRYSPPGPRYCWRISISNSDFSLSSVWSKPTYQSPALPLPANPHFSFVVSILIYFQFFPERPNYKSVYAVAHEQKWDVEYTEWERALLPHTTVHPKKELESLPEDIEVCETLGTIDGETGKPLLFDKPRSEGGKGWYDPDTGESCESMPQSVSNEKLFKWLLFMILGWDVELRMSILEQQKRLLLK